MATELNALLVEVGDPKLPRRWIVNVDSDNASTAKIIRPVEAGKRHWIESITIIGKPEDVNKCWVKILAGDDKLIGPIQLTTGTPVVLKFVKGAQIGENDLKIQTQEDFSIWMIVEGFTDAYGEYVLEHTPLKGQVDVPTETVFSWTAAPFIESVDVYVGETTESMVKKATTDSGTYQTSLKANKYYYWRLDCSDGTNTYKGNTWHFKTEAEQ